MPFTRRIVMTLHSGLGNQLFQLCAAETLRNKSGLPVFYDGETAFHKDPFGRQCELREVIAARRFVAGYEGGRIWRSLPLEAVQKLLEEWNARRRGLMSLSPAFLLALIRLWPTREFAFRSYFQSVEYLDPATVELLRRKVFEGSGAKTNEVAVHFRRSRSLMASGKQSRHLSETMLGMEYYAAALARVRSEFPPARYRVFSDIGEVPAGVFAPQDEVVLDHPPPGEPPWRTLSRMARCRHFVIANSTFSWWAAYLGCHPGKRVYYPQPWIIHSRWRPQTGVFPPEWERVKW